ncbi:hypothetical protein WJX72_002910 [[Myrmecia] bisecta]|uniref:Uncharacterized protein n=1 Tax=[Myrmecia] bisecta TaxID=41462 RepID=A0AAW1PA87_9CHLO
MVSREGLEQANWQATSARGCQAL